jgi:hypothetical protein
MSQEWVNAAALAFRFVLAFVFLTASVPKLLARSSFERAVANYALLPSSLVRPIAAWLPRLELLCAIALLFGIAIMPVAGSAAAMLGGFAFAVAVNLVRGREIDCGCNGSVTPRQISWGLAVGDLALAGMAIAAAVANPHVAAYGFGGPAASASPLDWHDALAMLILAGTLVLGQLLVSNALNLRLIVMEDSG